MTWQIASFCILAVVLGGGFLWYERRRPPARILALVAVLSALAVVGRLAFAALPNVKPVTDIVLFAGYALGGVPGFAVGAITAFVSNIFMSQGPWTPWQMVAWGGVGVAGAGLAWATRGRELNRWQLAIACGVAGAAFGAFMDVYQWTLGAHQDLDSYLAFAASSLPYNVAHVIGNVVFCLLIGPAFIRALQRYRRRLEVRWEPRPAYGAAAALIVALAIVAGTTASGTAVAEPLGVDAAPAASPAGTANAYLVKAQNADGGWGSAPKSASAAIATGWAILGLEANGSNPQDVKRKGGKSALAYVERTLGSVKDLGDVERTALVVEAAGESARDFGGRDLIAEMLKKRRADGSFANFVSYTSFGVLALRAAGEPAGSASIKWLTDSQNEDGGFGLTRGAPSDSDITGMVLQALGAVGRTASPAAKRAVDYLHSIQGDDGGFGQTGGQASNSQSTSYAVQGLVAIGADDASVDRARQYIAGLRQQDGSVAYSATSRQTPVWVTAQALLGLRKSPFPLDPVPAKVKPKPTKAASEESTGGGGSNAPSTGGGSSTPTPVAPADDGGAAAAPTPPAAEDTPKPQAEATPTPAPAPTPLPQSVPTPEPDPDDAASAQRAAAGAGDDGVPPGLAIGIGAAVLAALALLWFARRPLKSVVRRGGTMLPGKLRRSH